jgi:hypothetical protein
MANVKPIEQSADKWQRRAAVAGEDYRKGVESPRTPWDTASSAAAGSYQQGVTQAAAQGRYAAGIRRAGAGKWQRNSMAKGPNRFAEGVQLAVGEWQTGFAPYQTAISGLQLPPRGPAGSPQNLQRVTAVATALRAVRERTSGTAR